MDTSEQKMAAATASKTMNTNNDHQDNLFMKLPAELRIDIYERIFNASLNNISEKDPLDLSHAQSNAAHTPHQPRHPLRKPRHLHRPSQSPYQSSGIQPRSRQRCSSQHARPQRICAVIPCRQHVRVSTFLPTSRSTRRDHVSQSKQGRRPVWVPQRR
jgi:hypothetical protein